MIFWLLVGGLRAAEPAACTPPPELNPQAAVSMAWVAPAGGRVAARASMSVVPTEVLRAWIAAEQPSLGRLLQALGVRRRADAPKGAWVVGVFEVPGTYLCRPVEANPGTIYAGLGVCTTGDAAGAHKLDACGQALDRAPRGHAHLPVLRVRWEHAAARGFCVLPAERFLRGG